MTQDDVDQALQDPTDLAEYRAILATRDPDPYPFRDAALAWLEEVIADGSPPG